MSYTPGTLFRAHVADKSKHYTALLLKNGAVLELKNPDTGVKSTFDSFDHWRASHPDCTLEIDASKSSGIVDGSDTHGFNYPAEKHKAYYFIQWVYSIVVELAPHLLTSEELRSAYNSMVDLCNKHKSELCHWYGDFKGMDRYSVMISNKYSWKREWEGYPGYFYYENRSYNNTRDSKYYSATEYTEARREILAVYKKIVALIEPTIKDSMKKKYNIMKTQKEIAKTKSSLKIVQKKLDELQSSLVWHTAHKKKTQTALAKLEGELRTLLTQ